MVWEIEDCNRKWERKELCTVLFSREGICGQKLKVKKPTEIEDNYLKTYTKCYDPDAEYEKKRQTKNRLSTQQLKRQEKLPKYLEAARCEGARQNVVALSV